MTVHLEGTVLVITLDLDEPGPTAIKIRRCKNRPAEAVPITKGETE